MAVAFGTRVANGAGIGAGTLRGPSEGAGRGTDAFFGVGTTADGFEDGEKEKDDTRKLTGAPYQGPDPKFLPYVEMQALSTRSVSG